MFEYGLPVGADAFLTLSVRAQTSSRNFCCSRDARMLLAASGMIARDFRLIDHVHYRHHLTRSLYKKEPLQRIVQNCHSKVCILPSEMPAITP